MVAGVGGRARTAAAVERRRCRPSFSATGLVVCRRWRPRLTDAATIAREWRARPHRRRRVDPAGGGETLVQTLVGDGDRALMVDEFDGEDYTLGAVVDAAQTPPFLTDHRVVVARGAGRFTADELAPLAGYLADPLPSTELVIEWGSQRRPKAFDEALSKAGAAIMSTTPPNRARDRSGWVARPRRRRRASASRAGGRPARRPSRRERRRPRRRPAHARRRRSAPAAALGPEQRRAVPRRCRGSAAVGSHRRHRRRAHRHRRSSCCGGCSAPASATRCR